jgi:hypothetical protein
MNYSLPEICKPNKYAEVVAVRQKAMYVCSEIVGAGTSTIGYVFKRDHSCIDHAKKQIKGKMVYDPDMERHVRDLIEAGWKALEQADDPYKRTEDSTQSRVRPRHNSSAELPRL